MNLILSFYEPFIGGAIIAGAYLAGYLFFQRQKHLKEFRQCIRVGDLVRIKTPTGEMVNARIVKRNSAISFVCQQIENRQPRLTPVNCIFP